MIICEVCNKEQKVKYGSGRFCSRSCSNTRIRSKETRRKISKSLIGNIPWNKGKISIERKLIHCLYCDKEIEVLINNKKKYCSNFCKSKGIVKYINYSALNKKSYQNGRKVSGGKCKWFVYKDIKVQGTYELKACFILDNMKEKGEIENWEYTNDRFSYINVEGKKSSYLLDFKISKKDGGFYYLEVKGREVDNDILKWKAIRENGFLLVVWRKEDIEKYGDVV